MFVWLVIRDFVHCVSVSNCNQMITHRQKKQQNNRSMCNLFKDTEICFWGGWQGFWDAGKGKNNRADKDLCHTWSCLRVWREWMRTLGDHTFPIEPDWKPSVSRIKKLRKRRKYSTTIPSFLSPRFVSSGPSYLKWCVCLVTRSCPTLCDPVSCSPPGSSVHGASPGKNAGVGCHFLLQGIFPTQGSNPGLPHCRQILYHLSH